MRLKRTGLAILAFTLATAGVAANRACAAPQGPPPPAGYDQRAAGWDAPPAEFREIQREGFHDGIEGARKDFDNHRPPNVRNRDEFRHPHVPESARRDYREGFRRGYNVAMAHMTGEPAR
jgi:hypothetical protein